MSNGTRLAIAAVKGARPVWQTLQPFHFKNNRVHPTPVEFRHSVWSAVVHGAHGIGLWGVDPRNGFPGEDIRGLLSDHLLWPEVKQVVHAVRGLVSVIVSEEPTGESAVCDNEHVATMNKRWQGKLYTFVLNMRSAPERATLSLPVDKGKLLNQLRPGGTFEFTGGKCELELEPLQPLVLRLGK